MRNPQGFDYNQPSPDALAGIYVEVNDFAGETSAGEGGAGVVESVALAQVEQLFGLTLTVGDKLSAERLSQTPQER